jgi:hypothetical protein
MKVRGDHSLSVIDVHDVTREKEITDESNDSTIRCTYRLTDLPPEIDAEMPAGERSVEHSS